MKNLFQTLKKIFLVLFAAQLIYIFMLRWVDPPITVTQLMSWITGHGLKRDYVGYNEISTHAKLAVIAAEDQLFPNHNGLDWKSIEKALEHNSKNPKRVHGASTISQQVAKNVFLWQGRDWIRKGLEVYFTFMIETIWGKQRILEVYLNVVEMGDGIFGIEAAARSYFNKPATKLTRAEAAMIAACLPNPKVNKVKPLSSYVNRRHHWVMAQMNNLQGDPDIERVLHIVPKKNPKK